MAAEKPSIPRGTRDFSPEEISRRNYIFDTIRSVFELYGYQPIETPAMENLSTLLGKYGEEGDKLLFRILDSGNFLEEVTDEELQQRNLTAIQSKIAGKGLRYDLTVPFARYVVQYRNEITFPFKRYQIQPVWRADRPQKGRYREFYQCDADVIGSDSLLNEFELLQIITDVFHRLNIRILIKLNNRKILAGLAEYLGYSDKLTDLTVAMDKLEKIGREAVLNELTERGISREASSELISFLDIQGSSTEKLSLIREKLRDIPVAITGLEEMRYIVQLAADHLPETLVEFDLSLARGLNYYTGAIIEVKARDVAIGSICGGGRYDDLTGIFGLPGTSGVGISFGADRIYDVMSELNLFPAGSQFSPTILVINFGGEELSTGLQYASILRREGIRAEIYPDPAKIKKQMTYADKRQIPFVLIAGRDEMLKGTILVKKMATGEQQEMTLDALISLFKNHTQSY